ncbi:MAG TPA: DUF1835 domain-containing protein [Pyrinomonadaceae bacterium]|nr:DUF1835 domain-containing protein [Pyrinomonadaceae bacterium]
MLHIVNGESTAGTLRQSAVQGEMFSFRDALICGPTPAGVAGAEWRRTRARHLSEDYDDAREECEKRLLEQEQWLSSFSVHDVVVLWFEHDLFCQVNLLYLLDWFAQAPLGKTHLSLINIGVFPGKGDFRGLGELSAAELASLFPARQAVTRRELDLGVSAWRAYCSADPTAIEALLQADTTPQPFLKTALRAHLRRFPSLKNGLGCIENRSLELIDQGLRCFIDLFPRFGSTEPVYGLGDAQFWTTLKRLANASTPLVSVKGSQTTGPLDSDAIGKIGFELTDSGRAVLKGEADFVELNGIDRWLGGVHLSGHGNLWRWDSQAEKLALA